MSSSDDSKVWTLREVLTWMSKRFSEMDLPTPLLDAQLLLEEVLQIRRVQIYMELDRPLTLEERSRLRTLVRRRMQGEPVAYLLGRKSWHDLELLVDRHVLIPRPETESLLDFVLATLRTRVQIAPRLVVDLCTGSGCLAIALARAYPESKVVAVDISSDALAVAKENAERNGAVVEFCHADVSAPGFLAEWLERWGPADVLVANPPYISEEEWAACDISVRGFEPRLALVADDGGLAVGRAILNLARQGGLGPQGVFAMEMGVGHPSLLAAECGGPAEAFSFQHPVWDFPAKSYFSLRDLSARERFLCAIGG